MHTTTSDSDIIPLHELISLKSDDVARGVLFAASGLAEFVTGTAIVVDGGYLLI